MAAQELGFDTVVVAGENTEDSSHTRNNAQTRKEEAPYSLVADLLRGAEEEHIFSHSVQEQEALFCSEAFVANRSSVQPNTSDKTDGKRRADNQYQPRHFYSLPRLPLPDLTHLLGGNHPIPQHIRVFCERVFAACKDKPYHETLERREGGEPQNDPEICFAVSDIETVAEALYYRKLAQAVCTWWQRREIPAPPASHADHYEKDGTAKHAASKRGLVPRIKFLLVVADARLLLALPEVMRVLCGLGGPGDEDDTRGRNGAAGRGKAGSSLLCGVKLENEAISARKKFVEEAAAKLLKQVQNSAANREKAARRRTVTGKRVAFVSAAIENVLRQLQIGVTGFCVPLRIQHRPRHGDKGGTRTQPAQVRTAKVLAPLVKAFSYAFLKYKAAVMLSEDLWARKKANEAIDEEKLKEANLGERDREQDMEELVEEITAQCVVTAKLVAVQKSEFDRSKGEGDRQDHANSAKPLAELRSDMRSEIEAKIREGFLKAEKEAVQGLLKKSAEQLMEATKAAAPRQSPKATTFGSGSGETLAKALLFGDAAPATPSDPKKVDSEEDERDREPGDENASGTTISNSCPPAAVAHACETLAALLQQQNSVATLNAIAIVDLVRSAVAADCHFRGLTTNDVLAFVHSSWSPSSFVPAATRVLACRLLLQLCLNSHESADPVRESTIAELLFPFSDVPRYLLTRGGGGGAGARRDELQMRTVLRCFTDSAADLGRRKYWSPLQDEAALASLVMCNVLNNGTYAIPMVLAARELLRSEDDCYRFSDVLVDEMLSSSNSDSPLLGELLEELGIVIEKEAEPPATRALAETRTKLPQEGIGVQPGDFCVSFVQPILASDLVERSEALFEPVRQAFLSVDTDPDSEPDGDGREDENGVDDEEKDNQAFALDLFNHMGVDIWATPVNQLSQMLVRRDIVRGPPSSPASTTFNSGNKQSQTMREMRARKMQQRADKLTVAELLDYGAVVEATDASRPSTVEVEKKKNGKRRRRERKQASSFFCEMNREPGSSFKYSDAGYLALEALLDEFFLAIKFDRSSSEEDEQRTKTGRRRTSSDTEAEATLKEWETAVQNWLELSLEYDNEVDFQKERLTAADMDDVYAFSDVEQKSVTSEDAVASTRMGLDKAIAAWLRRKVRLDHEVTAVLVAPFQPVEQVEDAQTAESRDAAIIVLQSDKDDEDAANATSSGRTLRAVGAVAHLIAKLTTAFCVESPRGASRSGSSLDCFPLHQTAREMLNAENRASQQGALQLFGAQVGFGLFLAKMGQDHLAYQMLGAAGHFVVCFAGPDAGRGLVVARDAGSGSSALDAGSQARSQELAAALTLDLMRIEGWVEAQTWGSAPRSGAGALNWSDALPTQLERQLPFLQDDTVVAPAPPEKRATTTLGLPERIAVSVLKQTLLDRLPQPKHHSASARAKPRFPARSWLDPLAPLNFVCLSTTQVVKTSDESHGLATHLFSAHIPECKPNDSHRGSFHVDSWETKRHNLAHNHFDFVTFEIDPRFFSRKCADLVRLAYHKDYPKVVRYERMLVAERHTWDGESHSHVGREQAAVPENSEAGAAEEKRKSATKALDPSIAPFDLVHVNTIYHEHSECPSGCQLLVLDAETSAWEPILFRQAVQTRPIVPTKVALQGHSSQWWYIGLSEQQNLTRLLASDLRANRKTRFDFRIYPDGSVTRLGLFREAELLEEMREAGAPHTFFSRLIPPAMKDRKDVFLGHVDDLEEDAELENDGALVPAGVDGMQPPKTKEQKQAEADALAAKEKKEQANAAAQRWVAFLKDHSIRHFCERFHVVAPRAENHAKGHAARARALLDRNSAEKMSSGAPSADVVRANMPKIRDNERVNIASERFGAKILSASDEAYGPAARLLLDQPPLSPLDSFLTQRGRAGAHAFEQVFVKLAPSLAGRVAVESICLDFSFFVEEIPRGVELYGCYIAEAEYARRYEKQVHEVNNYVIEQLRKPRAEREDQREDEDLEARLTCASDLFEEEFFSPAAIKRAPEQLPRIRGFGVDGSSFAADFVPLMPRLYAKPYAGTTITLPLQQHGIRLSHLCLRLNPCGGLNRLRVNAVVGGGTTLLGRSKVLSGGGNRKDADDAIAADKNSLSSSGAEGGGAGAGDQHQEPEDDEDESASTHPRTLVDGAEDAAERDAAVATSSADEGELVGDRADADGKRKNTARGSAAEKTQRGATSVGVEDVESASEASEA
eukprot:g5766.t1